MKIRFYTRVSALFLLVLLWHSALLAEDIPLIKKGGVYELPVEINGALTLHFVLDSGASEVLIPADVVLTLIRTGTIKDTDFLAGQTYVLADGSTVKSPRFILRSLKIGSRILRIDSDSDRWIEQGSYHLLNIRVSKNAVFGPNFLPGFWTSLHSCHAIPRHIDRMFGRGFVLVGCPEITALLTRLPRSPMVIDVMGRAEGKSLVLHLTAPAASHRDKGRIAAYPLLATRRLHSRRRGIATQATLCTGHGLGFHPIVRPHVPLSDGVKRAATRRARFRGASRRGSRSPRGPCASDPVITPCPRRQVLTSACVMRQWSTVRQSRHQWQHQATQRADHDRSQRTQVSRVKQERDGATTALTEAQAHLRQRETQSRGLAVPHKVDLVFFALQWV